MSISEGFKRNDGREAKEAARKPEHMLKVIAELEIENSWMKNSGLGVAENSPY